jgi:hypothetical protein
MPLYLNGERFISENMEDHYNWAVFIGGPMALPSRVVITTEEAAGYQASLNESYFRNAGLQVETLTCSGYTLMNSKIWYKIKASGKQPLYLDVGTSTGSGGTFYTFEISWDPVSIGDAVVLDQVGKPYYYATLGSCDFQ